MTLTLTEPGRGRGYNVKTIKSILARKVKAWLESIEDVELRKKCERDVIVTGGSITSLLLGEKPNDFDIYMESYETTVELAKYYLDWFERSRKGRGGVPIPMMVDECVDVRGKNRVRIIVKSAGVESEGGDSEERPDYEYFENRPESDPSAADYVADVMDDPGEIQDTYEATRTAAQSETTEEDKKNGYAPYRPKFLSSNAITLADGIQIVLRFYGSPEEIHETFDFTHCTCWFRYRNRHLEMPSKALQCILSKTLVYQGSLYPVCSIFRIRKFTQRGWHINAGQVLKILMQVSALDLNSYDVLEDQLTGVDVAYFTEVLNKSKEKDPEKVDSAYLVEIIDRMFDA